MASNDHKNKKDDKSDEIIICIVGLGYVGLPLAVAFGKQFKVIGFDLNKKRIEELKRNIDKTNELSEKDIKDSNIIFTDNPKEVSNANFIIAAVPTPVKDNKEPDLSFVESASRTIGQNLKKGSIVVFESTVYPGVTEDICVPIIEKNSGLRCGKDWKIGYSPERINPGDREHTIEKVIKVVSGMDKESLDKIAGVYSSIVKAGVYKAQNIKTAEAAKVIENIQRDLNIALMNELSLIFSRIGLNTKEVLDAAGTKWNFHRYHPGLVGGHCIGIDPYYMTYLAQRIGYDPKVILAGREINDSMAGHVAGLVVEGLKEAGKAIKGSKVLLMGLAFKENVPDIRNSKAKDIARILKEKGAEVIGFDPLLEKGIVKDSFGIENVDFESIKEVDAIVLVNSNKEFEKIGMKQIKSKMKKPVLVDVKNFYKNKVDDSVIYKGL